MQITDLITGLAFVNAHVGLYRLDKGLRDGISIPMEQLQSHVQMVSRSAQIVALSNQIQQLKGQADKLQKQQLNAQHAQLMVQISQLQLQLHQLQAERQRLELEVKREQRLAQENRIFKIFVDLYDQAQTYRQQGQLLDHLVVVLAALRIYRQIYNDLDDANNRIRISELKERLYQSVRDLLNNPDSRQRLADQYVAVIRYPVELTSRGREIGNDARRALEGVAALRQAPADGNWQTHLVTVDSCISHLETSKAALTATRAEYIAFTTDLDSNELFFPINNGLTTALVGDMDGAWANWISTIEAGTGHPLAQMSASLHDHPLLFEQDEKAIATAIEEAKQLRITDQFSIAAASLVEIAPAYLERFQQLQRDFQQLPALAAVTDPVQIFDTFIALQHIRRSISTEFSNLRKFIRANPYVRDARYLPAAAKRLKAVNADEQVLITAVAEIFGLEQILGKFDAEIGSALKGHENVLDKAVETDDSYQRLQERVRSGIPQADFQEIEGRATNFQPGGVGKIFSVFKGNQGKEIDRRRFVMRSLVEAYLRHNPVVLAELPDLSAVPPFPIFPETKGFFGR